MKISDFLINNNVGNILEKEVIISDRFVDDEGNYIPFKIRNIKQEEMVDINRLIGGDKYLADIYVVANCCIEPNFNSIELQNHYGVTSGNELVSKILLAGEINTISSEILKLSGYGKDFEQLIKEGKKH